MPLGADKEAGNACLLYTSGQVGYRALRHRDPRRVEEFRYIATAPTLQRARDMTGSLVRAFWILPEASGWREMASVALPLSLIHI